ncbi:MAG TPA: SRPBCC family protein [Vicinamibacterales bacterium]|nr:SRPBCC family protein [Vicinamibacterales bacterium]
MQRVAWAPPAGGRPRRGLVHGDWESVVPASLEDTFAFFSDPANLERLTPPWLRFRITTAMPVVMSVGVEIDYLIVLHAVPIPWRSRIDVWEPGVRFVDRQVRGPYRWWRHEHLFEAVSAGTRVIDRVEFVPRLRWITGRLVRRDVARIFAYRQRALSSGIVPPRGRTAPARE